MSSSRVISEITRTSRTLIVCAFAMCLAACGAKKSVGFASSRGPSNTPTTTHKLGECNRVQVSSINLYGQIGTYYESSTGQYRGDYLNLNLSSVPEEIFEFDNFYIQFFRWSEKTLGQKIENQIPVRLFFRDKLTGYTTSPTTVDRLSRAVLQTAKNTFGATWVNVSLAQFFERTMVILTGMDLTFEGVAIKFYDNTNTTAPLGRGDVLLPAFVADPNIYKTYNPFPDLYTLHPNYTLLNSGATENDYVAQIEEICRELAGIGSRIPASVEDPKTEISLFNKLVSTINYFISRLADLSH